MAIGFERLWSRSAVPLGTLLVNVAGCLLIGYIAARLAGDATSGDQADVSWLLRNRPLLVPGFCGALTTFSAFGLETIDIFQRRGPAWAMGLVALHLVLGLGAVVVGQRLGAG